MTSKDNLSFDPDEKYLALPTGGWDHYKSLVLSTSSWVIRRRINCSNKIGTPSDPLWSPGSNYLAPWEAMNFSELILEIYSVDSEEMIGGFRKIQRNMLIGICAVVWSPNGQIILIGCHDKIYLLNYLTWNVIYVLQHKEAIEDKNTDIYLDGLDTNEFCNFAILYERPVKNSSSTPLTHPVRLPGISRIIFSSNGQYVASQKNLKRAMVWIWSLESFSLIAVVVLNKEVVDFKWDHSKTILLLCSKPNVLALWNPTNIIKLTLEKFGFRRKIPIQEGYWRPQANGETREFLVLASSFALIVSGFR